MAVFESLNETTDKALEKGQEFIKNSEAYYKLKIFQMTTASLSLLLKAVIFGSFMLIAFLFIAFSLAVAIGNALDSNIWGYIIVALLFIGLAVVSYLFREHIENAIIKKLSYKFFDEDEENIQQ
ncbi:MAG TPA: hypothetical protein VJ970_02165 [Flavobacteriaceae bacterium]|nr:hypothetical protein [Flavobacteriaceae bacterium]